MKDDTTKTKIKITMRRVIDNSFTAALDKLNEDTSIRVKDRYALARSIDNIRSEAARYNAQRMRLFKEHGAPELGVLQRQLEKHKDTLNAARKQHIETRVAELAKFEKPDEALAIDPEDKEKSAAFDKAVGELQDIEFEIFLNHKIQLTDACKLNAKDIFALDGLVEVEE